MSNLIPNLTADLNAHQNLPEKPTLTSSELKIAWDKPVNDIKDYINSILLPQVNNLLSNIDDNIASAVSAKLQARYHVGSIIVSESDVNPATYLGFGTWELTGKGRVEIGYDPNDSNFDEAGKTGGNSSITLNKNQIPTLTLDSQIVNNITKNTNNDADLTLPSGGTVVTNVTPSRGSASITNNNQQAINIIPKYTVVYRYKRTA